jgi:hypothetical protein
MSDKFENKYTSQTNEESEYAFQTVTRSGKPKTIGWSLASLICGIAALITSVFGWPGIVLGVLAIVFAVISRIVLGYFDGMLTFGFILGLHGIFIGIASIALIVNLGDGEHSNLWDYITELIRKIKDGPV